jgi:type II secretory pathway component PulK
MRSFTKAFCARSAPRRRRASVLIIVLWVTFGLVSIALYFGHSMVLELRATDNRVAQTEADQAIEGAARYITYVLSNLENPGMMPDLQTYEREAVPVGEATFWLIGRADQDTVQDQPFFSLMDEASKLSLNLSTNFEYLPRMTPELTAAIVDWRDADDTVSPSGAEAEVYSRLRPPYKCKNAPFETVDELRLVYGAHLDILYGEDSNLNGVLDPNENDGNVSLPDDNRDGRLDPGLLNYVTVYSRELNVDSAGTHRINVAAADNSPLRNLLTTQFATRGGQMLPPGGPPLTSVLEFFVRAQASQGKMTAEEFGQIADQLCASDAKLTPGLVNVNTASAEVLSCIPGIGSDHAQELVSYRRSNPDKLNNIAWVAEILNDPSAARTAGPFLTVHSYQFMADIAAVGHYGRGYRRVRFIFDTTSGTPRIVFRQDLSHLGWALGRQTRERLLLAKNLQ